MITLAGGLFDRLFKHKGRNAGGKAAAKDAKPSHGDLQPDDGVKPEEPKATEGPVSEGGGAPAIPTDPVTGAVLAPKPSVDIPQPDFRLMVDEMRIPVRNLDRTVTHVTYLDQIEDDELAYAEPGGKAYHTRAGCYRNWSPAYRSCFTGWDIVRVDDAEARGMHKCSFCQDAEYLAMNPNAIILGYGNADRLDPEVVFGRRGKPELVFTATVRNPDVKVDDFSKGDEISEADVEASGAGMLYRGDTFLCNSPKPLRIQRVVSGDTPLEMRVLQVSSTPKGFVSLRIAVYEKRNEDRE